MAFGDAINFDTFVFWREQNELDDLCIFVFLVSKAFDVSKRAHVNYKRANVLFLFV